MSYGDGTRSWGSRGLEVAVSMWVCVYPYQRVLAVTVIVVVAVVICVLMCI